MKTGESGHFEFLGQKVKILAFSHKKLFKNVILIIGNYTNDIRSKNFKKKQHFWKKNMVANFGFKITFLNSFLCEKIDSFQKFLKHALCHKSDFNFSYNLRNLLI